MSAVSVAASTSFARKDRSGSSPRTALQQFRVAPIPISTAKSLLVRHHYLHSLPGGTQLAFGVFLASIFVGAMTVGCGPSQAYRLVDGVCRDDCAVLTRLWLSDELPRNSESKVIGIVMRALNNGDPTDRWRALRRKNPIGMNDAKRS